MTGRERLEPVVTVRAKQASESERIDSLLYLSSRRFGLPAARARALHSHDVTALDCTDSNRCEAVHGRVGRSFDGLAPVDQVRARSSDADLVCVCGGRGSLSLWLFSLSERQLEAYLDDLGKDGGEGHGEEESEDAGVQVPEGAAPDEGDQGHQDQGDDSCVDDTFACVRASGGFQCGAVREATEGGNEPKVIRSWTA